MDDFTFNVLFIMGGLFLLFIIAVVIWQLYDCIKDPRK